ncbi:primosomal replication protein [Legionella spiritensis]|uniref:primosomal replication protein n=1 Tax=Legionella spiritensis TaxID=452 RepID=UPI000F6B4353|nr:primosomal replication protein [Legionella spiritensis]VEG91384.1 putative protein conserved in archaea [Legionella spiritensis]
MSIKKLLDELSERLPELEWQLGHLDQWVINTLPKGLFKRVQGDVQNCIDEIRSDIQALVERGDSHSAVFLAERIKQKINVLVVICHLHRKTAAADVAISYNVDRLASRQQWLQSLGEEIERLTSQQQALLRVLHHKELGSDSSGQLQLQKELGLIAKRLTIARETYDKSTQW